MEWRAERVAKRPRGTPRRAQSSSFCSRDAERRRGLHIRISPCAGCAPTGNVPLDRHAQRASVHQLLREYEILGEILEEFIETETQTRQLEPTATECLQVSRRLARSTRTLMRTTVDTFVAEYTAALQERNERIDRFNRMTSHELRTPIGTLTFAAALLEADIVQAEPQRLATSAS